MKEDITINLTFAGYQNKPDQQPSLPTPADLSAKNKNEGDPTFGLLAKKISSIDSTTKRHLRAWQSH